MVSLRQAQPDTIRMKRMLDELTGHGIRDEQVLDVMSKIPREVFLAQALQREAYDNAALPIGENQTISQPLVVAKMTETLQLDKTHKVLEIGTGCGYQLAILCKLARRVYSIERHRSLSDAATTRLQELGFHNFVTMVGDGSLGWAQQAPFDRIIVTAAGPDVPPSLIDQLAVGGILVIPVGLPNQRQELLRCIKQADGRVEKELLGYVDFVPLIGREGVQEG